MWNYRIVKYIDEDEELFELREVYYDQLGKPMGHCSSKLIGDTAEELQSVLDMMSEGCSRPIFNAKDFE
jgi:hypothetical protein